MLGKILKVYANDVNGNVDDRRALVFSAFQHTKYMNNYVVFTFEGDFEKNKLYYGSVHIKQNSLVVFSIKDDAKIYIDKFLTEYENNNLTEFKIFDISELTRIELVSFNEMEYNKIKMLNDKTIPKEITKKEEIDRPIDIKGIFLYVSLVILIILAVVITIIYLFPNMVLSGNEQLICNNREYDKKLQLYYDTEKNVKFNSNSKLKSIDVIKTYTFLDTTKYEEFKNNQKHLEYFKNVDSYKYVDESLQLKLMYKENNVIDDYDEMLTYLKKEGFSCELIEYEK